MRWSMGAILIVTVPNTFIRAEWRGEAHVTMPKRSTSKRDAKVAIISMAQHARPKVTGQMEDLRAQLKSFSGEVTASHPPGKCSIVSKRDSTRPEALSPSGRSWWSFSHSWRLLKSLQTGDGICGGGGFTSNRASPLVS